MDFFALEQELRKGKIPLVLYVYGDEPYLIEKGVERLQAEVIPDHLREFNREVYSAGEVSASRVVDAARTLPMLNQFGEGGGSLHPR
jgi:DNA polymerase-3 subunit delta